MAVRARGKPPRSPPSRSGVPPAHTYLVTPPLSDMGVGTPSSPMSLLTRLARSAQASRAQEAPPAHTREPSPASRFRPRGLTTHLPVDTGHSGACASIAKVKRKYRLSPTMTPRLFSWPLFPAPSITSNINLPGRRRCRVRHHAAAQPPVRRHDSRDRSVPGLTGRPTQCGDWHLGSNIRKVCTASSVEDGSRRLVASGR